MEFVIAENKAVLWINLKVLARYSLFGRRRTIPTLVLLHFVRDEAGQSRISLQ